MAWYKYSSLSIKGSCFKTSMAPKNSFSNSGKSYSIGWLSFMLTNLFKNEGQERVFDSIIIITDRKVLDKQLQDTVKSLEKVQGVVQQIDKNSEQLKKSLENGKNIIITTIQKFSVVVSRMKELNGMRFGVIVDCCAFSDTDFNASSGSALFLRPSAGLF